MSTKTESTIMSGLSDLSATPPVADTSYHCTGTADGPQRSSTLQVTFSPSLSAHRSRRHRRASRRRRRDHHGQASQRQRPTTATGRCCSVGRRCLLLLLLLPVLTFVYWPYLIVYAVALIIFISWYCCCRREARTGLTPEQIQERIIKRKCLRRMERKSTLVSDVETAVSSMRPEWGINVVNNQLTEDAVSWPVDDSVVYLFSKPLSMADMKAMQTTDGDDTAAVPLSNPGASATGSESSSKDTHSVSLSEGPDTSGELKYDAQTHNDEEKLASHGELAMAETTAAKTAESLVADETTIVSLDSTNKTPHEAIAADLQHAPAIVCDICLEEYKVGSIVAWSKNGHCKHAFHVDCITDWFLRRPTCPSCRQAYITVKKH